MYLLMEKHSKICFKVLGKVDHAARRITGIQA